MASAEDLRNRAGEIERELDSYYGKLDPEQRAGAPEESSFVREREEELAEIRRVLNEVESSAAPPPPQSPPPPQPPPQSPPPPSPPPTGEDPMAIALRAGRLVSMPTILSARSLESASHQYVSENLGKFLAAATHAAMERTKAEPTIVEASDLLIAVLHESARDRERGREVWHGGLWQFVERVAGDARAIAANALQTKSRFGDAIPSHALAGTSLIEVLAQASDFRRLTNKEWYAIGVRHAFTALMMSAAGRVAMQEAGLFPRGFNAFRDAYATFIVESGVGYYKDSIEAWQVIAGLVRGIVWYPPGRDRTKVASDDATVADRFGAKLDADALAELITLESAGTPMAIGIFGHWGAGKSTLMRLVQTSVEDLTKAERALRQANPPDKRDDDLRRVADVVQIRFNAWTYADSENLWASLTAEFFDQLAARGAADWVKNLRGLRIIKEIAGRVAEEQKVAAKSDDRITTARRSLAQAQDALGAAERRRDEIDNVAVVEALSAQLDVALQQGSPSREALLIALPALGVDAEALGTQPPSRFLPPAEREKRKAEMAATFSRTVLDFARAPGDVSRLLRSLPHLFRWRAWMRWNNSSWIFVLAASIAIIGAVSYLSIGKNWETVIDNMRSGALWSGVVVVVGAMHFVVRAIVPMFRLLNDFEERRARKAVEVEKEIEEQRKNVREREDELAELNKARDRALVFATTYEQAARGDSPAMALQYLLQESADLSAVRARLGFLATVRRCFEHLEDLIRKGREANANKKAELPAGAPQIDRIVIYIDDLDRCSEAKVVQVLEAVHLLLAFEFFVVIVAVDPRWLRLALASHYAKQLAPIDDGVPDPLRPTVSDYVEKIFQIPFLVRSLSENDHAGYRTFLDGLLEGQVVRPERDGRQEGGDAPFPPGGQLEGGIGFVAPPGDYVAPGVRSASERKLLLSDAEVSLLHDLGPLAAKSPRAVKRMMNVYRLMRVRLSGSTLEAFVNGAEGTRPGFHAIAFALACEVGLHPSTASAMERVVDLAATIDKPIPEAEAMGPLTPFATALDEAWLDSERAHERNDKSIPRSDDIGVVRALAEALAAEGKTGIVSNALATLAKVHAGRPPDASELMVAFREVRRYSFRA